MVSWLLVIILAYLFFSLSNLGDKLILAGPPQPSSYTFYIGVLGLVFALCIPFVGISIPQTNILLWIIAEAVVNVLGLYTLYSALEKYEVSKVITTIGVTQSIFIFALTWVFWGIQPIGVFDIIAFILLILGSMIISSERNFRKTEDYLKITLLSSFLFSLDYIFSKIVFLSYPFLQGFIWMRICIFLLVMFFLLSKSARKEIFRKQNFAKTKAKTMFIFTQISGGLANVMQAFAIFLAPIAFLPIVNSLRGLQYVFLFIMTMFLSFFFPKILKESLTEKAIFQKIISTILIGLGFWLLII